MGNPGCGMHSLQLPSALRSRQTIITYPHHGTKVVKCQECGNEILVLYGTLTEDGDSLSSRYDKQKAFLRRLNLIPVLIPCACIPLLCSGFLEAGIGETAQGSGLPGVV